MPITDRVLNANQLLLIQQGLGYPATYRMRTELHVYDLLEMDERRMEAIRLLKDGYYDRVDVRIGPDGKQYTVAWRKKTAFAEYDNLGSVQSGTFVLADHIVKWADEKTPQTKTRLAAFHQDSFPPVVGLISIVVFVACLLTRNPEAMPPAFAFLALGLVCSVGVVFAPQFARALRKKVERAMMGKGVIYVAPNSTGEGAAAQSCG